MSNMTRRTFLSLLGGAAACPLCGGWRRMAPVAAVSVALAAVWRHPSPLIAAPAAASDLAIYTFGASFVGLESAFL